MLLLQHKYGSILLLKMQQIFEEIMKKILAVSILSTFTLGFMINPACAILDKKTQQQAQQATILDYVNFDWWKKQNDEHLEKYIVTAINNNNDIKTAALKIEQAKLNVVATRAGQLPIVELGAGPTIMKMPNSTKSQGTFALPIIAFYELDLFGKNWDKTKSSKKLLQGVEYQTQASDIAIVSMVATTYYNIVKLDKLIEVQQDLVQDRKEIYDLMKLSNEEGIVSTATHFMLKRYKEGGVALVDVEEPTDRREMIL